MIILDYVNSPSATTDDKIRTLRDSMQRAFATLERQQTKGDENGVDIDLSDYLTKNDGDKRYAIKGESGGLLPNDVRTIVESYRYATNSSVQSVEANLMERIQQANSDLLEEIDEKYQKYPYEDEHIDAAELNDLLNLIFND